MSEESPEIIIGLKAQADLIGITPCALAAHMPDLIRRGYPARAEGGELAIDLDEFRRWLAMGDEVQSPAQVERLLARYREE